MVAVSTVKTEDGKVTCETPEGTVINININQRSFLDSLLDVIKNARIATKSGGDTQTARKSGSGVFLGVGVSCMSLGFVSVILAVLTSVIFLDLQIRYAGTNYWFGFVFLVSGVLNVVAYKYPKAILVVITFIFLMGCFAVSIAGMVFVIQDISRVQGANNFYVCENLRRTRYNNYFQTTPPGRYYYQYGDNDYYLEDCKRTFRNYKDMQMGLVILSLVMMIWGLCVSAITLGYRLKVFFSACKCEKAEDDKDDPMLSPNPTEDIIIA